MRVDLRCADVFVTQQFLHGANIIPVLQKMRGEGVTKGVRTDRLANLRKLFCRFDCPLHVGFVQMMAPDDLALRVFGQRRCRENP